ncbi:hypothetical protein PoB_003292300 [Plakobranchus ocellatus]|uniref:Uncharacterized protein n=1 Tax=Plakobranchus ocellatus TaxID=259542 RepID=A0AAV4AIQ6_9GAST|nr:hypothetical protein PoB_003292300 [Plakobranchus ocellatus]
MERISVRTSRRGFISLCCTSRKVTVGETLRQDLDIMLEVMCENRQMRPTLNLSSHSSLLFVCTIMCLSREGAVHGFSTHLAKTQKPSWKQEEQRATLRWVIVSGRSVLQSETFSTLFQILESYENVGRSRSFPCVLVSFDFPIFQTEEKPRTLMRGQLGLVFGLSHEEASRLPSRGPFYHNNAGNWIARNADIIRPVSAA